MTSVVEPALLFLIGLASITTLTKASPTISSTTLEQVSTLTPPSTVGNKNVKFPTSSPSQRSTEKGSTQSFFDLEKGSTQSLFDLETKEDTTPLPTFASKETTPFLTFATNPPTFATFFPPTENVTDQTTLGTPTYFETFATNPSFFFPNTTVEGTTTDMPTRDPEISSSNPNPPLTSSEPPQTTTKRFITAIPANRETINVGKTIDFIIGLNTFPPIDLGGINLATRPKSGEPTPESTPIPDKPTGNSVTSSGPRNSKSATSTQTDVISTDSETELNTNATTIPNPTPFDSSAYSLLPSGLLLVLTWVLLAHRAV